MRELCQHFSLKAARGRGKVVVIDDADDLNDESANCFLKTLEEPPPGSVLILIGSSTDRQKPTIMSRCQVVRFRPLPAETVAELLQAGGVEDPDMRERLARLGGGSPGQALGLADPDLWKFRRTLLTGLTGARFDPSALAKAWIEFVQDAGKEAVHQRRRARLVLRLLIDFLRAALAFGLNDGDEGRAGEDRPLLEAMARRADADRDHGDAGPLFGGGFPDRAQRRHAVGAGGAAGRVRTEDGGVVRIIPCWIRFVAQSADPERTKSRRPDSTGGTKPRC